MAKQVTHPADLATRFKLEKLKELAEDKKKHIEDLEETLEEKQKKELKALEEKNKKEIEALQKKTKQELAELEKQKQKELEESTKLLDQAIEEAKIDERLWRETDEKVMRRGPLNASIDEAFKNEELQRLERQANQQATQNTDYQPMGSRQNLSDQRRYEGGQSDRRRNENDMYDAATKKVEAAYAPGSTTEQDRAKERSLHEDVLDNIDSTRATLKRMGYKL